MNSLRLWFVIVALAMGALLVACGGDGDGGDGGDGGDTGEPTATVPAGDGEEPQDGDTGEDNGGGAVEPGEGEAFADVPLPEGADEISTLTMSGGEAFIPPGGDIDAERIGEVTMTIYQVDGSPADVLAFYKDRQGDWEETFSLSTDEGGLLVWTAEGGNRVVWISTGEGDEPGTTSLSIWEGSVQE